MNPTQYDNLNETIFQFEHASGLKVMLVPKADYHKTFAVLTTDFGAEVTTFELDGERVEVPAGTAHFLEHKLFEKADGDTLKKFSQLGAQSNAFTNYTQTSYLFSTTQQVPETLKLLLEFVQTPYFTQELIDKEQGIIGQEIQMYEDDPDWEQYMTLLEALYPGQPLAQDIAGTIETIRQVTPTLLEKIHRAYYQPSHLTLTMIGHFDVAEISSVIDEVQAQFSSSEQTVIERSAFNDTAVVQQTATMAQVSRPRLSFGIKGAHPLPHGKSGLRYSLSMALLIEMLFGETSDWYQQLYEAHIVDTSFSADYELERAYHFVGIFAETDYPDQLQSAIEKRLQAVDEVIQQKDVFERERRALYGESLMRLNKLSYIASQTQLALFDGQTLYDEPVIIQSLTTEDLVEVSHFFKASTHWAHIIMQPKSDTEGKNHL